MTTETKTLLQSKTFWGVVIMLAGTVMTQFHLDATSLTGMDDVIVQLIGAFVTVYGRVKAVKKIG